jgi:HD-GYP domain-containing protein (c-di-GMP phosphodiesterase class II)/DNA-binding CsgD family transcriptional regulator
MREHEITSCEVAQSVATELGLPSDVCLALGQVFERYDGKGHPGVASGDGLHLAVRTWHLAHTLDLLGRHSTAAEVVAQLRRRSGGVLDPVLVEAAAEQVDVLLDAGRDGGSLGDLLAVEPEPVRTIGEHDIDTVLGVLGWLADAKSPYFRGHSDAVAELAATAARAAGCAEDEVRDARRAGLVADIGKVAVSSRIWNSAAPLSDAEWEQVRLHPYFTQRVLSRVPSLDRIVDAACSHHERSGGAGYHRGLGALTGTAALVAVADAWVGKGERRAYREVLSPEERTAWLRAEVEADRLPRTEVEAVLAAAGVAGGPAPAAATGASGSPLSPREAAVLDLVADGLTNRAIGSRLGISPKTVNTHLEHAYSKLGVSTRVAAVVVADRHGWLPTR